MTPADHRSFVASVKALKPYDDAADGRPLEAPTTRVVLNTYRGTLHLYFAKQSDEHDGLGFVAIGMIETLEGPGKDLDVWSLVFVDEPGNRRWCVCSSARMQATGAADFEVVQEWSVEKWESVGGLCDPDTGAPMMGWLDAKPAPRLQVVN